MKHNDSIMVTYVAPKCIIMDIMSEGVLCESDSAANGYGLNDLGEI